VQSVDEVLRQAAAGPEAIGARWAVMGGLAVAFRAEPRFTKDVAWSGLRSAGQGQGATVSGSPGLMTLTGTSGARRRAASTKRAGSLSLLRKILSPTAPLVKA
jgi:hypothetical protein